MVWKPHVTVAAVIEKDGHFLLVEETTDHGLAFNQPAGHLEPGEDLISAVKREVEEETACNVHNHNPNRKLDADIVATHWLSRDQITTQQSHLRSPLVLICVDEYLKGRRYPLSILQSYLDLA